MRLRLGAIAADRIERLSRADSLLKANFNPDEPRDDRGRWSDDIAGDFTLDDPGGEGSAGSTGGDPAPTSAGGSGPAVPRAWERYPNADFRNRLAVAERSAEHQNFGYGEVNNGNNPILSRSAAIS